MRRLLIVFLAVTAVVSVGCQTTAASGDALAGKAQEIAELKAQLKQRDQQINDMKRELTMVPPPPNQTTVAVGHGDGRFVVIPSKVRPGFPVGIFSDLGGVELRLLQVSDGKEIARMAGPKASHILVYTIPADLTPGSYRIAFWGNGGTFGEAVIQVEAN